MDVLSDPSSVPPEGPGGALEMLEANPYFQDVPNGMLDQALWRGDTSTRLKNLENMPTLEARATVLGIRHGLRFQEAPPDHRGPAFGESRAASFSILILVRRASA
eukprot:2140958-Pyramimonas_sp.AAC.1